MKKSVYILLCTVFVLSACSNLSSLLDRTNPTDNSTPTSMVASSAIKSEASTNTPTITMIQDNNFTAVDEPADRILSDTQEMREQPYNEEEARQDVDFILQAFYYSSGSSKRSEVLGMDEETLTSLLATQAIQYFNDAFTSQFTGEETWTWEGKTYTFYDEIKKQMKSFVDSYQVSNQYEITDLFVTNNEVYVTVEARTMDYYQLLTLLSYLPNYETTIVPLLQQVQRLSNTTSEDRYMRKFYEAILWNLAVAENNDRMPLEYRTRTQTHRVVFTYDDNGYLRVPLATLLTLTSVRSTDAY